MKSKVVIKECNSYDTEEVENSLRQGLDLLGGIENFINAQDRVLLKPNLLLEAMPEQGVTTHNEVVRAVARVLKGKCSKVFLGDSPSVWGEIQDINRVFEVTGMKEVAESEGVELVNFNSRIIKKGYPVTNWIDKVDKIINLPKFKTHDLMTLTACIKNLYGIIPGLYKKELHKHHIKSEDFARILVDIFELAKPSLNIVDAVCAMEGEGPGRSGTLKNLGLLLIGENALSVDSVLAYLMRLKPANILTNLEASKRNLGSMDLDEIEILGESLREALPEDFQLPVTSFTQKIPGPIANLVKAFIKIWPFCIEDKCISCGKCIKACPKDVISFVNNKKITFDYSGCIRCFCCMETCPVGAIEVKRSVFARALKY